MGTNLQINLYKSLQFVFILIIPSKCQIQLQSIFLDANTSLPSGISLSTGSSTTIENNTWNIVVDSQYGVDINISLDASVWGFHPFIQSTINITIDGFNTFSNSDDNDLIVLFSVDNNQFFTTGLHLDKQRHAFKIYPPNNSILPKLNVYSLIYSSTPDRWNRLSNNNFVNARPLYKNEALFPMSFIITNDPINNILTYKWIDIINNKILTTIYSESFDTEKGMDIYIAGDSENEEIIINSFQITYTLDIDRTTTSNQPTIDPSTITDNPTKLPSNNPTLIPISKHPTKLPSNVPTVAPNTRSPTTHPTSNQPTTTTTINPNTMPTSSPITDNPSNNPTLITITKYPTQLPSNVPTLPPNTRSPTEHQTSNQPTAIPIIDILSIQPTIYPNTMPTSAVITDNPSNNPTLIPNTKQPSLLPSNVPTLITISKHPTQLASKVPTLTPDTRSTTEIPSVSPTEHPTSNPPTTIPSNTPNIAPITDDPTQLPSTEPTSTPIAKHPTEMPSVSPTKHPTSYKPTLYPFLWILTATTSETNIFDTITTFDPTDGFINSQSSVSITMDDTNINFTDSESKEFVPTLTSVLNDSDSFSRINLYIVIILLLCGLCLIGISIIMFCIYKKRNKFKNPKYSKVDKSEVSIKIDSKSNSELEMNPITKVKIKYWTFCSDNKMSEITLSLNTNDTVDDIKNAFCKRLKAVEHYTELNIKDNNKYIKLTSIHKLNKNNNIIYASNILYPSQNACQYAVSSHMTLALAFPDYVKKYLSVNGCNCFCDNCCDERKDSDYYTRGNPKKRYVVPRGWYRFGINKELIDNNHDDDIKDIFRTWHRSYHGTTFDNCLKIFKSGLILKKPGSVVQFSCEDLLIKPRDYHIQDKFQRYNYYNQDIELFDPKQIFTSPSIKYSSNKTYAKPSSFKGKILDRRKKQMEIQTVFQCLQKPTSYNIGQETIRATKNNIVIDKYIDNKELEWYTTSSDIVIYGLLIKLLH